MDDLLPVIEHIAEIANKTEGNKWELAEAIHTAFDELPSYEHGLLSGLCEKLRYTPANVYNYRDAWGLKQDFPETILTVSHMARLHGLAVKHILNADDVSEYIQLAEQENWSVRKLAQEVESNHEPDPKGQYEKSIRRLILLGRKVLSDPLNRMPKMLRANLYDLIKELEK